MAAGKWKFYDSAKLKILQGIIDFDAHTFKVALFTSSSNANTLTGSDELADLTNQVAGANGYTTGETLTRSSEYIVSSTIVRPTENIVQ